MAIVVLGATGNLGLLVVQELLHRGAQPNDVVAAGRQIEKLDIFEEQGVNVVKVDYDDPDSIGSAINEGDTVLLISSSDLVHRKEQHAQVVDQAKKANVGRLAYTSVLKADTSPLAVAPDHRETERLIKASGLTFTFLRNGWYTENFIPAVQNAKSSGVIIGNAGDGKVASATRGDLAAATAKVLMEQSHENAIYELGGLPSWDYSELAVIASDLLDSQISYKNVTASEHKKIMVEAGAGNFADFTVAIDDDIAHGYLNTDSDSLEKLLGRPTTSLKQGLAAGLN